MEREWLPSILRPLRMKWYVPLSRSFSITLSHFPVNGGHLLFLSEWKVDGHLLCLLSDMDRERVSIYLHGELNGQPHPQDAV